MNARRLLRDILLNRFVASALVPRALRWRLLRAAGASIPSWCAIMPDGWYGGTDFAIGEASTLNYGVFVDCSSRVSIGSRCDIGMQVMFCTGTHTIGPAGRRAGSATSSPIAIGDGVWIGARATILPGVTIGDGCVIAAGAVVSRDCEPRGVYAGVPARRVRDL